MLRASLWGQLDYRVYRVLAIAWMALIFYLSSQESLPMPGTFAGEDKLIHFMTYGLLGMLAAGALGPRHVPLTWPAVAGVALFVLGYGVSDEYHQMFVPGRDASWGDLLADGSGGVAGALLQRRLQQARAAL